MEFQALVIIILANVQAHSDGYSSASFCANDYMPDFIPEDQRTNARDEDQCRKRFHSLALFRSSW
jgi:hypothetical protein